MEFGPNSWLVVPGHTVSVKTGTTRLAGDNRPVSYTLILLFRFDRQQYAQNYQPKN